MTWKGFERKLRQRELRYWPSTLLEGLRKIKKHHTYQGRTQERGCQAAAAPNSLPPKLNFKKTQIFVDIMMSKVLRDFPFS
jgi:hypothetical protein